MMLELNDQHPWFNDIANGIDLSSRRTSITLSLNGTEVTYYVYEQEAKMDSTGIHLKVLLWTEDRSAK
jgi:hypothetical protein